MAKIQTDNEKRVEMNEEKDDCTDEKRDVRSDNEEWKWRKNDIYTWTSWYNIFEAYASLSVRRRQKIALNSEYVLQEHLCLSSRHILSESCCVS